MHRMHNRLAINRDHSRAFFPHLLKSIIISSNFSHLCTRKSFFAFVFVCDWLRLNILFFCFFCCWFFGIVQCQIGTIHISLIYCYYYVSVMFLFLSLVHSRRTHNIISVVFFFLLPYTRRTHTLYAASVDLLTMLIWFFSVLVVSVSLSFGGRFLTLIFVSMIFLVNMKQNETKKT